MHSYKKHSRQTLMYIFVHIRWWSGIVVSTLASINEVDLYRGPVSTEISGAEHLFRYVTNQPRKVNSAFHPSGVG